MVVVEGLATKLVVKQDLSGCSLCLMEHDKQPQPRTPWEYRCEVGVDHGMSVAFVAYKVGAHHMLDTCRVSMSKAR